SLIDGKTAIDNTAADLRPHGGLIHFGVPTPAFLACARIDGEDNAPVGDPVDRAIPEERRAFLITATRPDVIRPCEAETAHIRRIHLFERAVPRLAGSQAIGQPL